MSKFKIIEMKIPDLNELNISDFKKKKGLLNCKTNLLICIELLLCIFNINVNDVKF
jgi:hypothetical protein